MTLTPKMVTAPLSEASHPPSSPHPIKASFLFAACRLGCLLRRQHALPRPPPLLHTPALGTLARSACSHLGTRHPPGHPLTGAATPVFFHSHLNGGDRR